MFYREKRYGSAGHPIRGILIHSLHASLYTLNWRCWIDAPDHGQSAFRGAKRLDAVVYMRVTLLRGSEDGYILAVYVQTDEDLPLV